MPNQDVINAVEQLGVAYELISIDPADADTVIFCEKYGYPLEDARQQRESIVKSK